MKRSYVLEFKRVADTGERYVSETQKLAEIQHLAITESLKRLFKELENLFRSYWAHRLGVSDGLLQVLGHHVRVKTQEVQSYQLQAPEQCVSAPV